MSEPIHLALNDYDNHDPNHRGRAAESTAETREQDREADRILDTRRPRGFDDLASEIRDMRPRPVPPPFQSEARTQEPLLPNPIPPNFDARNRPASQPRTSAAAPQKSASAPVNDLPNLPDSAIGSARSSAPPVPGALSASTTVEKYLSHIRQWLPYAQKVLVPLLEGNVTAAIGNLLNPPGTALANSSSINTAGIERSVAEVTANHRELRGQMMEQAVQLKRVEDQLERVREATDRNTLEQQELVEDLRNANSRIRAIVVAAVILLLGVAVVQIYILFLIAQPH